MPAASPIFPKVSMDRVFNGSTWMAKGFREYWRTGAAAGDTSPISVRQYSRKPFAIQVDPLKTRSIDTFGKIGEAAGIGRAHVGLNHRLAVSELQRWQRPAGVDSAASAVSGLGGRHQERINRIVRIGGGLLIGVHEVRRTYQAIRSDAALLREIVEVKNATGAPVGAHFKRGAVYREGIWSHRPTGTGRRRWRTGVMIAIIDRDFEHPIRRQRCFGARLRPFRKIRLGVAVGD